MSKKKGLGRGLGALISEDTIQKDENIEFEKVIEVDINKIEPDCSQPRASFDENSLNELAKSIESIGIINPIIVKQKGKFYEIISGERRWRSARIAKLKTVPVLVKEYTDIECLEASLVENIQREDLNPIEEALCFKKFADNFNFSQEEIAGKVGKSRAAVTNALRLLKLDNRVQNFVKEGRISSGHARAILSLDDKDLQFEMCEKVIEEQLSVRQIEELIKNINEQKVLNKRFKENKKQNDENKIFYDNLAQDLRTILGTKVNIKSNKKEKGKIEIEYYSNEELDRIICILKK